MKIYTSDTYNIISIDKEPSNYKYCFETNQSRSDVFKNLCDTVIKGYKYEPQYEIVIDNKGNRQRDNTTGEYKYKLDEEGSRIFYGYACYPYLDYMILELLQKQYEDFQKQDKLIKAQIAYLSMMSGIDTEVKL